MQKEYKFNDIKLEYNGMYFGSKKELERYIDLKKREERGFITELRRNVPYELLPAQEASGSERPEKKIVYIADFVYRDSKGREVVEDVKSFFTHRDPVYKIKRKLMRHVYGISIREI